MTVGFFITKKIGFGGIEASTLADSCRQHSPALWRIVEYLDVDGLKAALAKTGAGQMAEYRVHADEFARPFLDALKTGFLFQNSDSKAVTITTAFELLELKHRQSRNHNSCPR